MVKDVCFRVIIYVAVCNLNIWPNQYCQTTFNLLSVCTASMFKEEKDMQKPIYCGPISLVLKMSRVFGMAPLTFGPDGIKFSQVFYIYSIVFIASLSKCNDNIYLKSDNCLRLV